MTRVLSDLELETFPALEWPAIAARTSSEVSNALEQVMTSQDGSVLTREQCLLLAHAEGDDLFGMLVAANSCAADWSATLSPTSSTAISISRTCALSAASFAPSAAAHAKRTPTFLRWKRWRRKAAEAWDSGRDRSLHPGRPAARPASVLLSRHSARGEISRTRRCTSTRFRRWRSCTAWNSPACRCREYLLMLRDNGLDTLPGTAAEILDDEVRHVLSRNKLTSAQWSK